MANIRQKYLNVLVDETLKPYDLKVLTTFFFFSFFGSLFTELTATATREMLKFIVKKNSCVQTGLFVLFFKKNVFINVIWIVAGNS